MIRFIICAIMAAQCAMPALGKNVKNSLPMADALTVEHRTSPLGLDIAQPRFGWQIVSGDTCVMQRSYRIIVSSTRRGLESGKGDIWDSGTVKSDSSQWVAYKGVALRPNTEYYWRVAITTNKGGKPQWSDAATWSTGLLAAANWQGCWIGLDSLIEGDRCERHSRVVSRMLRKAFSCRAGVKRATLHISGLGLYVASLNGKRIGNSVMTPVGTQYDKTVAYDTYDITNMLGKRNAIGVTLAGGHYFAQTQNYQTNVRSTYGMPKLRAMIIVEYKDGKQETIATDGTWKLSTDGATRYANDYDGELYDARLAKDFSMPDFDDSQWASAQVVEAPQGILRGNITPSMKVYAEDKATHIDDYGDRAILDFATNGAGRLCLTVKAGVGDTVRIRHAEMLDPSGKALYTTNLRAAEATAWFVGDGKAHQWHPDFTYYGFRYAEISVKGGKVGEVVNLNDVSRQLIADEMSTANNEISISGDSRAKMLEAIVANARRGIMSNYKGMPLDCPQRDERMPWLGDRTIGCTGESYLLDCYSLYSKWTRDICDAQREDGNISDVSPAYWRLFTGNVTWPAALPFAASMLYRQYGDLQPMRTCYDAIIKWLNFIRQQKMDNGLVTYDKYGDWCVPPEDPKLIHSKDPARKTDGKLLSSTYYYYLCRMMSRYSSLLGKGNEARELATRADTTLAALNRQFLMGSTYSNGTVTANVLPLAMGIVPDSCRSEVEKTLIKTITEKNSSHISCGVIGIGWIMRQLADMGRNDLAYTIATRSDYPSWGYMVKNGATTIWELWNGDTADPSMNSANHVMLLGDLLPWCFEKVGGIVPDEEAAGFKHFHLKPDFSLVALDGIAVAHQSPYGKISSQWHRTPEGIEWTVEIPANTTATLHFPDGKTLTAGSGVSTFTINK